MPLDPHSRRTQNTRGEQAVNARELVILFGRVCDIIGEEFPDEQPTARVLQRLDREVFGGPEHLEQRADKPWLG